MFFMQRSRALWRHGCSTLNAGTVDVTRRCLGSCTALSETISYIKDSEADREIYVVGTAHISEQSAQEVGEVVATVRPDYVAVELCNKRAQQLRAEMEGRASPRAEPDIGRLLGPLGDGIVNSEGAQVAMRAAKQIFGLGIGADFKAALAAADKVGAQVALVDRDIDVTLARATAELGRLSLPRLVSTPIPPELERWIQEEFIASGSMTKGIETAKVRRRIAMMRLYLSNVSPGLSDVIIRERDEYMVDEVREQCPRGRIVLVVGMAHMDGIGSRYVLS